MLFLSVYLVIVCEFLYVCVYTVLQIPKDTVSRTLGDWNTTTGSCGCCHSTSWLRLKHWRMPVINLTISNVSTGTTFMTELVLLSAACACPILMVCPDRSRNVLLCYCFTHLIFVFFVLSNFLLLLLLLWNLLTYWNISKYSEYVLLLLLLRLALHAKWLTVSMRFNIDFNDLL